MAFVVGGMWERGREGGTVSVGWMESSALFCYGRRFPLTLQRAAVGGLFHRNAFVFLTTRCFFLFCFVLLMLLTNKTMVYEYDKQFNLVKSRLLKEVAGFLHDFALTDDHYVFFIVRLDA